MKRYALILEASQAKGQGVIDGCKRDAERWEAWLKSNPGGAWNKDEVQVVNNVWKFEIDKYKPSLDAADFAVVAFSGHGRIVQDFTGHRKQKITLGNGEEIDFDYLIPAAPKKIMSCDACREVHVLVKYAKSLTAAFSMESFTEQAPRAAYRTAFDQAIAAAANGAYTMYSCSAGECAGEDALNGGLFTDTLLSEGAEWFMNNHSTLFRFGDAFQSASPKVSARARSSNNTQTPIGSPSIRNGLPFPFAVAVR